jgi:NitT/TauT family transport system substrate-binding protein
MSAIIQSRRGFIAGMSAIGAASAFSPSPALAEEPIETTTVRIADFPGGICIAPQYVAEELLRQEGFTDVVQVPTGTEVMTGPLMARDEVDFGLDLATALAIAVDRRMPITGLAGVHAGCYVLFGREGVNSILDLKGRRVGIGPDVGSDPHLFVSVLASYVGLDPRADIEWVQSDIPRIQLFAEGKIDAILSFPPEAQELQRRKIGHIVVSSVTDRPWSEYFCCILAGRQAYVQNYPNATKRVVRAILKAADICIFDPESAVRLLVGRKTITPEQYSDALVAVSELKFRAWREYDPEDSLRFFALRLREAGMITSNPQEIIAKGTDWSFLKEVKRELKA